MGALVFKSTQQHSRWRLRLLWVPVLMLSCGAPGPESEDDPDNDEPAEIVVAESLGFGEIPVGQTGAARLLILNQGGQSATLRSATVASPFAVSGGAASVAGEVVRGGQALSINLTFEPEAVGAAMGEIVLDFGAIRKVVALTAEGTPELRPAFTVSPALDFSVSRVGSQQTRSLRIENVGTLAGSIESIIVDSDQGSAVGHAVFSVDDVNHTLEPGETLELDVHFAPTAEAIYSDYLLFGVREIEQGFSAQVLGEGTTETPTGTLSCTPNPVDFGTVSRGTVPQAPIVCSAVGGGVELTSYTTTQPFDLPEERAGLYLRSGTTVERHLTMNTFMLAGLYEDILQLPYLSAGGTTAVPVTVRAEIAVPDPTETGATIRLTWDTDGTDIDLHLTPDGVQSSGEGDCYWADKTPDWGVLGDPTDDPFLDTDDVDGFGPENINIGYVDDDVQVINIRYFAGQETTNVTVEVFLQGELVDTLTRPMTNRQLWRVAVIDWEDNTPTYTLVDRVGD